MEPNNSNDRTTNTVGNLVANDYSRIHVGNTEIHNYSQPSRQRCLVDLRLTDPRDDKVRIEDTKGGILKDSYKWILDHQHFRQWRENGTCGLRKQRSLWSKWLWSEQPTIHDDQGTGLLWIQGHAGKGKTMLLCGIINELEGEQVACVAYFFCQATEPKLNNGTAVLRGLIYMLVIKQPSLISHLEDKYDHAGKSLFEDGNSWYALSSVLRAMIQDERLQNPLLIVDALDECDKDSDKLLQFIANTSASTQVQWLVSSRHRPNIQEDLAIGTKLCLELNQDLVSNAVNTYIRFKVDELALKKEYDEETKNAVLQHLVSHAEALVSVAHRPLTIEELVVLMEPLQRFRNKIKPLEEIIGSCDSFLTLRKGVVYFVHQSAQDYLVETANEEIFPSGVLGHHLILFTKSMEIIMSLKRNIYHLKAPGVCIDDISRPEPDPLSGFQYYCLHWINHLLQVKEDKRISNHALLCHFIQKGFLYWLEALSLMRELPAATKVINEIQHVIEDSENPEIKFMIDNAQRFLRCHIEAIMNAPLQVYASALIFSPTESLITGYFKKEEPNWVKINPKIEWDACMRTIDASNSPARFVAFSPDGQRLVASGTGIIVWDTISGECIQISKEKEQTRSPHFLKDGQRIIAGIEMGDVALWDVGSELAAQRLGYHDRSIMLTAYSCEESLLTSFSTDGIVKTWDLGADECIRTIRLSNWSVDCYATLQTLDRNRFSNSITLSENGKQFAAIEGDERVKIWDVTTGECESTFGNPSRVTSVCILKHNILACGLIYGAVTVWDLESRACIQTLKGHDVSISCIIPLESCCRLASAAADGTIKIWNNGECIQTLKSNVGRVVSLAFSKSKQWLASAGTDYKVRLWDLTACSPTQSNENSVTSIQFSPNGQWLVSCSSNSEIKIWDTSNFTCTYRLLCEGEILRYTFSPDSRYLALFSRNTDPILLMPSTVRILDTAEGNCIETIENVRQNVVFSPDGRLLALFLGITKIAIWKTDTRTMIHQVHSDADVLAFSPDGHFLALASAKRVEIWDLDRIHICNSDCFIRSTSLDLGRITNCDGHEGIVYPDVFLSCIALSADSQRLVACVDTSLYLFNTATGALVCEKKLEFQIKLVGLSPNGMRIVIYGVNVTILDVGTGMLIYEACSFPINSIRFDSESDSRLWSNIDTFDSNQPVQEGTRWIASYDGYNLSMDSTWICNGHDRALWLPSDYRTGKFAIMGPRVAIASYSGYVLLLQFE